MLSRGFVATIIAVALIDGSALADVKFKTRTTLTGKTSEAVTYVKGPRRRINQVSDTEIDIDSVLQCDLRRTIYLNNRSKRYLVLGDQPAPPKDRHESFPKSAQHEGAS